MSAQINYLEDLDAALAKGCQVPNCEHSHGPITELYLHQRCHAGAGLEAWYQQGSGIVILHCRVCRKPVVNIAVAKRP